MTTNLSKISFCLTIWAAFLTASPCRSVETKDTDNSLPTPVAQITGARGAAPMNAGIDINSVINAFREAMQSDPNLRGAWLFYDGFEKITNDGVSTEVHKFRRVFDARNVDRQTTAMNGLLVKWLPQGNYSINPSDDQFFPLSELLQEMIEQTEFSPQLAGSILQTAYYEASAGSARNLNLVLRGLIADGDQAKTFDQLCGTLMRRNPAWLRPASPGPEAATGELWITPSVQSMVVWEGSADRAIQLYVAGINSYWRGDYFLANQQFRRAVLESPRDLRNRYWQALTELTLGRTDRCARLLRTANEVVGIRAGSADYSRVSNSLERIQGRTRQILLDLEFQAIFQIPATGRAAF